jgi:hypothetical protein
MLYEKPGNDHLPEKSLALESKNAASGEASNTTSFLVSSPERFNCDMRSATAALEHLY